jgi:hypothetical protein
MNALALMLVLAAARVDLVDETFTIPPSEWRYVDDLHIRQHPVMIAAGFEVDGGAPPMRLLLMRREDVDRLREDRPHGILAATPIAARGKLRFVVHAPGDFAVVLDNRLNRDREARAHLRLALDFTSRGGPAATYLPPTRRLAVILISFAVFFFVVIWSGRRIIRAIRP